VNTPLLLLIVTVPPTLAIRGLLAADADDERVLAHGVAQFEGLYAGASGKE
jgi:hypothetical protein